MLNLVVRKVTSRLQKVKNCWSCTFRLSAHWQLNCCGDEPAAGGGTVNVSALQLSCWRWHSESARTATEQLLVVAQWTWAQSNWTVVGGGTAKVSAMQLNSSWRWHSERERTATEQLMEVAQRTWAHCNWTVAGGGSFLSFSAEWT